jgi:hypothetical protein
VIFDSVVGDDRFAFALADYADKRRVGSIESIFIGVIGGTARIVFAFGVNVCDKCTDLIADGGGQIFRRRKNSVVVILHSPRKIFQFVDGNELPFAVFAERINRRRFTQNLAFFRALRNAFEQIVNRIWKFSVISNDVLPDGIGDFIAKIVITAITASRDIPLSDLRFRICDLRLKKDL